MTTISIAPSDLKIASEAVPTNVPIVMLNLLRFKEHADYGDRTGEAPCSGQEAYMTRYVPSFGEVVKQLGVTGGVPVFLGASHAHIVAPPDEKWDIVVLVEYPNFATFHQIVQSQEYQDQCAHHRIAALDNWRLIATTKIDL